MLIIALYFFVVALVVRFTGEPSIELTIFVYVNLITGHIWAAAYTLRETTK